MFSLVVVICLYLFTRLPEIQVNRLLGSRLLAGSGIKISIGKMNRDLWRRLDLGDISVNIVDADSMKTICWIGNAEVEYSLKDVVSGDLSLRRLKIDSVRTEIDSRILEGIPRKSSGDKNKPAMKIPRLKVDEFDLSDVSAKLNIGEIDFDISIGRLAGAFEADGKSIKAAIDTLYAEDAVSGLLIDNTQGKVTYTSHMIDVESLVISTALSDLRLAGTVELTEKFPFKIEYAMSPLEFSEIERLVKTNVKGQASLTGTAEGTIDDIKSKAVGNLRLYNQEITDIDCHLRLAQGRLTLDEATAVVFRSPAQGSGFIDFKSKPPKFAFDGRIEDLNLRNIGIDLYSRFSGEIDLVGQGLAANSLKMAIDMKLDRADIDIYHFHEAEGRMEFDFNKLTFDPGFKARYKQARFEFGGWLEYQGEVDIAGKADFGDLSDFKNQFFIADLDGRGESEFRVTGPLVDFDFNGTFHSDSCRFYGLVSRDFRVDLQLVDFISHMRGPVRVNFGEALLYSIPVDSGEFTVEVDSQTFYLEGVKLRNENNRMTFEGLIDNTIYPAEFIVDSLQLILWEDTLVNSGRLRIEIDTTKAEFRDFKLGRGQGYLELTGELGFDNSMNLTANFSGFAIAPLIKYFHYPHKVDGVISGRLWAGGVFESPVFDADLAIKNMAINEIEQGDFSLTAYYSDRQCQLKSARLVDKNSRYEFSGLFPIELSFDFVGDRLLDLPIQAVFRAEGTEISLIAAFVPAVEYCRGKFDAAIEIRGTYGKPSVGGTFHLRQGTLKALDLVNPIDNVNITGRMENDLILVDSISGRLIYKKNGRQDKIGGEAARRGLITGKGKIKIIGLGLFDYDLRIAGENCEFFTESYDIQGTTDFDVTIAGSSPPVISGSASLSRLDMKEGFATFSKGVTPETEILEDSTQWTVEVEISALNNLWIKNSEADMEMMGNVLFFREAGIPHLLGQLNILRGNFYLFNYEFKIDKGEMVFNDISEINPQINFEVKTKIRNRRQYEQFDAGGIGFNELGLVIGGSLLEPEIRALAGSNYTDEDILRLLLANQMSIFSNTGSREVGLANNILNNAGIVLSRISDEIERTRVIDELEINPYADSLGQTRVSVAKYLSPKLYLRYSRSLSAEAGETIGLEYLFNRYLSIQGRQGSKNEGISFDLIFNYEF